MIITLDNSSFTLAINPGARPPMDPKTGEPLSYAKERVEHLISGLRSSDRLVIPTPVLAEVLVGAGDAAPEILTQIENLACLQILPFDKKAAVELAAMTREAKQFGSKKGVSIEPWQKVKFDRQIIAIARGAGSDALYSDDSKLCAFAKSVGLATQSTWDLPMPDRSADLFEAIDNDDERRGT